VRLAVQPCDIACVREQRRYDVVRPGSKLAVGRREPASPPRWATAPRPSRADQVPGDVDELHDQRYAELMERGTPPAMQDASTLSYHESGYLIAIRFVHGTVWTDSQAKYQPLDPGTTLVEVDASNDDS
jgi:hypothetical protein